MHPDVPLPEKAPVHPGQYLQIDFMQDRGMTAAELAAEIGISQIDLDRLLDRDLAVTPDLAAKLGQFAATSSEWWLNIQAMYDAWCQHQAGLLNPADMLAETRAAVIDRPNGWQRAETGIPPVTDTPEGGTA